MKQTFIHSLSTTSGFLENAPISFLPGLNCVIGARGTCKSTIVETLRFCFDCDATRVRELVTRRETQGLDEPGDNRRGLIHTTLAGGAARVALSRVESSGQAEYLLERDGVESSATRIYRDSVKEQLESPVLDEIEIYSQGDLHRIAIDGAKRLELIDRPNQEAVQAKKIKIEALGARLAEVGRQIKSLRSELGNKRSHLRSLGEYRAQLADIQRERPLLSDEMDAEREAHGERSSLLREAKTTVERMHDSMSTLEEVTATSGGFKRIAIDLERVGTPEAKRVATALTKFAEALAAMASQLTEQPKEIDLQPLTEEFDLLSTRYHTLRQDQVEVNESLRKEDACKTQIQLLERMENEFETTEEALHALLEERTIARQQIAELRDAITTLRLEQIDEINSVFGSVVVLTLGTGTEYRSYHRSIEGLLKGSKLRDQSDVAKDLASRVTPGNLVDIVESGDAGRLSALLKRDLGQMTRLLGFLLDADDLYDLEAEVLEDHLEVTMYVDGVPKPIHELSKGQMATALLPLILRNAPYPLVFDQPEDDLDNKFVYETMVTKIEQLKAQRQLIFVTHNANIPVLGGAENVVVMSMASPNSAAPAVSGKVDEVKESILSLLEGGANAFTLRSEQYGALVGRI